MDGSPIRSSRAEDPRFAPLLEAYGRSLQTYREELERSLELGDRDRLRVAAHSLKGSGASYGYPELTTSARELERALDDDAPENEVALAHVKLVRTIEAARAGLNP